MIHAGVEVEKNTRNAMDIHRIQKSLQFLNLSKIKNKSIQKTLVMHLMTSNMNVVEKSSMHIQYQKVQI